MIYDYNRIWKSDLHLLTFVIQKINFTLVSYSNQLNNYQNKTNFNEI